MAEEFETNSNLLNESLNSLALTINDLDKSENLSSTPRSTASSKQKRPSYSLTVEELVRHDLIHDYWKIIESKKSCLITTLPQYSTKSLTPPKLQLFPIRIRRRQAQEFTSDAPKENILNDYSLKAHGLDRNAGTIEVNDWSHLGNGVKENHNESNFNQSRKRANIHTQRRSFHHFENLLENQSTVISDDYPVFRSKEHHFDDVFVNGSSFNANDVASNSDYCSDVDEETLLDVTSRKGFAAPLPSFDDWDLDKDDRSTGSVADQSEILFGDHRRIKKKTEPTMLIYDNLVGRDFGTPITMRIPQSSLDDSRPRVGELNVDELSDLSENEAKSSLSESDIEESEQTGKTCLVTRQDSCVQTDESYFNTLIRTMKEAGTVTAADVIAEIEAEKSQQTLVGVGFSTLSTEGGETDPKFARRPNPSLSVCSGEPIRISCSIVGTLPIDVFWFHVIDKKMTDIETDDRCQMECRGDTHKLTLYRTSDQDKGEYLCVAVNSVGLCIQAVEVDITRNIEPNVVPSFVIGLEDKEVTPGEKLKLFCQYAGSPEPQIMWFKDSVKLKDGDEYHIDQLSGNEQSLVVDSAVVSDSLFSVFARNVSGEACSTAHIKVKNQSYQEGLVSDEALLSRYPGTDELARIASTASLNSLDEPQPDRTPKLMRRFSYRSNGGATASDKKQTEPRLPTRSKAPYDRQQKDHLRDKQQTENKANESPNFEPAEDELKTRETFADEEEDINLSYEEFEKLFAVGLVSRSQLASGRVSKKNVEKIRKYLQDYKTVVPSSESGHNVIADGNLPLTVNCGLKQVESEFYQRDYVVHSPIPMPRKKRNPSQRSESLNLDYSARKSDVQNESGPRLQSVKDLRMKFSQSDEANDSPFEDSPASPLHKVYSLTSRNIPKTVRDRLKNQSPSVVPDRNIHVKTNGDENQVLLTTSKFRIMPSVQELSPEEKSVGDPLSLNHSTFTSHQTVQDPIMPVVSPAEFKSSPQPERTFRVQTQSLSTVHSSAQNVNGNLSKTVQKSDKPVGNLQRPPPNLQINRTQSLNSPVKEKYEKPKNSTVLARASFWQKLISKGQPKNEDVLSDFPQMPKESFKSSEDGVKQKK